jgi:hypothetical protein
MHRPPVRPPPVRPGEILRDDVLPAVRLSVTEAARQLGVARQTRDGSGVLPRDTSRMTSSRGERTNPAAKPPDGAVERPRRGTAGGNLERLSDESGRRAVPPGAGGPSKVVRDPLRGLTRLSRAVVLVCLVVWTWRFARVPMGVAAVESVLHLPDLVFHEAGHVLFGLFGRFLGVLGGSLFQFALPLALAGAFLRQSDPFGAVVCTWWAGQNLLDLAPYIADARALQLVLLGGKTGAEVEGHDWEYLLTELGWLRFDRTLGLWAHRLGLMLMVGALVWGAIYVARNRDHSPEPASDRWRKRGAD